MKKIIFVVCMLFSSMIMADDCPNGYEPYTGHFSGGPACVPKNTYDNSTGILDVNGIVIQGVDPAPVVDAQLRWNGKSFDLIEVTE